MYHPTTRVLAVLALLQTHGRMTGAELAHKLEVNIRTLRRYIIMLQDLGIPIEAERGRNGAYVLGTGFKLPPMMFTNEEALALTVGLIAARGLSLSATDMAVESALAKVERVMPHALKGRVRALSETVKLGNIASQEISPDENILSSISNAAQQKQTVHLRYEPAGADASERDFDPYGLTYYKHKWYVVGYCHLRLDLRSFRLDRITEIQTTSDHFERPQEFDPLAYIVQSIATMPRKFSFEVLLKTDLPSAQREVFDVLGILETSQEGVILRGSVEDLDWLARQLSRFSFDFIVHEPQELKAFLKKRALELTDLANME